MRSIVGSAPESIVRPPLAVRMLYVPTVGVLEKTAVRVEVVDDAPVMKWAAPLTVMVSPPMSRRKLPPLTFRPDIVRLPLLPSATEVPTRIPPLNVVVPTVALFDTV